MIRTLKTMDGNTAAAHVSYAFTEVAAIYPITPSSVMAELADKWSAGGQTNIFGRPLRIAEMQSEGGAAGAVHGSLLSGALTTTYTASQGLLLMIPNMFKIAAEQLPNVIHVSARTVATHALSIFGDHSDVMACRSTGYAMMASSNPQEVMDLGAVAHMAAIEGRVPVLHFFDGFRTSHEMQKIEIWDYDDLNSMVDHDAIARFRANALNPEHPVLHGSAQNPDMFFQNREACNSVYNSFPAVVEKYMDKVNEKIGTNYKLFNYYGAPDADRVIILMGSGCDTAQEVADYLNRKGEKVGVIMVRLYRPFAADRLIEALPKTVKKIAVMDRTKEPGALGEPLYLDVVAAVSASDRRDIQVVGGRYGLSSKNTTPGAFVAVFDNLKKDAPQHPFTVGIEDDVTNLSLPITEEPNTQAEGTVACKFWGLGSDGTVGANKNSIKIIGDYTDKKVQAYFQYDSKKSGGVTISHIRFGDKPIKSTYYVSSADFVACHNQSYIEKYDMVQDVHAGGVFLLNCTWSDEELISKLPASAKRHIANNNIKFYTCNAVDIAKEIGLGGKTNMILQAAFFKLANIIPIDDAVKHMKDAVQVTYGRKGEEIVAKNMAAIDAGLTSIHKIDVPESWKTAEDGAPAAGRELGDSAVEKYVKNIMNPANAQHGDSLPVSAFTDYATGVVPQGTAAYEKRGIAVDVPMWIGENCIQCNQCAFVCPHAAIRPFVFNKVEADAAPEGTKMVPMNGKGCEELKFSITVSPYDCVGCGVCVAICPAKTKALVMKPLADMTGEQECFNYAVKEVSEKELPFAPNTVKGSQFKQPLLEFSGACAGCGETPYAKLITQLYGDHMMVANATGCTSIWGGSQPSTPYTVNKQGKGVAWANSLFEDNAEFGYGMMLGVSHRREDARATAQEILQSEIISSSLRKHINAWLDAFSDSEAAKEPAEKLRRDLTEELDIVRDEELKAKLRSLLNKADIMVKPSIWIFGGDGWSYDIGFGGLDHVLASRENVNIFVFDTEVYSNTGGQASKASQTGQVAQFAAAGKVTKKKDLAAIAMSYGYCYVAQVAMGASYQQTLRAITEAESYDGPSIVIGYAPCINHGIKVGMANSMLETKLAVEAGYWHMFRYDPRLAEAGKNPFQLDSKEPTSDYRTFLMREVRYNSLGLAFPKRAETLFAAAEQNAKDKYAKLKKLAEA